ncbi:rRNA methylase, putative, group 3 [Thiovulum sp. ES]|nr:rRNA methylase, putative, group 3 [Thiovulum sp. ES]
MIIYGKQPILYLLKNHRDKIEKIFLSKEIDKKIFHQIKDIPIERVDTKKAQGMARGGNHQGFLAQVKEIETLFYGDLIKKNSFVLILHGVTDVGNIGGIIRTAYSLGVEGVIISGIQNISFSGIARSSSGAVFDMPLSIHKNILDILNEAKQIGFKTYGASADGTDVREVEFPEKRVLVVGSEGEGIPNRILKSLNKKVAVSMERDFDSLNVSVATGILIDRMRV